MAEDDKPGGPTEYEVGYGKPPKKTQFKPGHSGNPKGRPRRPPKVEDLIAQEALRMVTVTIDGQQCSLPQVEVVIRTVYRKAMAGDLHAAKLVLLAMQSIPDLPEGEEGISNHELQLLKEVLLGRASAGEEA